MKIATVTDRTQWEEFINEHSITTFMQSWAWGEFEIACNHKVNRFFLVEGDQTLAAIQTILIQSKRGTFLYIPHGPIVNRTYIPWSNWGENTDADLLQFGVIEDVVKLIHKELVRYANDHECSFIRINSSLPKNTHLEELFQDFGYRPAPIYLTSENAAVLDISQLDSVQLLANMRKTTRYLINKAIKEDVQVVVDTSNNSIQKFMTLYSVTTKREKFIGFGEKYIKSEFEAFGQYNNSMIVNAYYQNEILATALILFTKNSAFYHQGASNHPKIPAPYLLQWRAIQIAMERKCKFYNFWGTYIPERTPKSWQGLSLFKLGFGTQIWNYLPTYDYPLKASYYLTNIYEHYIRLKRGV